MAEWLYDRPHSDRLDLYSGVFDVVNGTALPRDFANTVRWWALTYRHIIVPDGYFHSYGPIYHYLKRASLDDHEEPSDPILALLTAGVIVPAVRGSESKPNIHVKWNSRQQGVVPGQYLALSKEDGADLLKKLGSFVTLCVPWPEDQRTPGSPATPAATFADVVSESLTDPGTFLDAYIAHQLPRLPGVTAAGITAIKDIAAAVKDCAAANGPLLRRGHLEQTILNAIRPRFPELQMATLYNLTFDKRLGRKNPPIAQGARDILDAIGTVYELRDSRRYRTVGGLFKHHSRELVAALHGEKPTVTPSQSSARTSTILADIYDIRNVPIRAILAFRRSDTFRSLQDELVKVTVVSDGTAFSERNKSLVAFLTEDYLPQVLQMGRKSIGPTIRQRVSDAAEKSAATSLPRIIQLSKQFGDLVFPADKRLAHLVRFGGITIAFVVTALLKPVARRSIGRVAEKLAVAWRERRARRFISAFDYMWKGLDDGEKHDESPPQ